MSEQSGLSAYDKARSRLPAEDAPLVDNPSGMYCRACRQTGVSHCSDPENCGGMERMRSAADIAADEPATPEFIERMRKGHANE